MDGAKVGERPELGQKRKNAFEFVNKNEVLAGLLEINYLKFNILN